MNSLSTVNLIPLNIIINKTLSSILITLLYELQVRILFADFSNGVASPEKNYPPTMIRVSLTFFILGPNAGEYQCWLSRNKPSNPLVK